jgi:tetratricopeptide (TPR) repeat protein
MPRNSSSGVFVSCVSSEFERADAAFPGLRSDLRHYLTRAKCAMIVQEDFPQTAVGTVRKLDGLIRDRAAVIHLVGEKPGVIASAKEIAEYLAAEPTFLVQHPEIRAALGDFSALSYTQWEALIALHLGIPLFIYSTPKGAQVQKDHLKRLELVGKYAATIKDTADLLGQLIGDIHTIISFVPKFERKIAPSRILRHSPAILFGRERELEALDKAWADQHLNLYTLVAWGGVGKTSLVAHWVAERLMKRGWPGVERYFDWSFYSQGTGESRQTSADYFINEALQFFGDPDPKLGNPWERGERLAGLIRKHRTLLVLDGIEPLQYPPTDKAGKAGRLKDPALEALVQSLAADNPGLCIITTREHLTNVEALATTEEKKLDQLLKEAAIALLRHLQITGTDEELEAAWKDAGGHALTLQLLGRFIADAYPDRDIRHYKDVGFEEADKERHGRSAFKVMIAYERWLASAGPESERELALLRLTGLFDRPISADCLQALRAEPAIPGLTDALVKLKDTQWNVALTRLIDIDLLSRSEPRPAAAIDAHRAAAIDAHPLVREYFSEQLQRESPEAFRAAHSRLFDHLCKTTPYRPDDLPGLLPLYQAVAHGCHAGQHLKAFQDVYWPKIAQKDKFASMRQLGAYRTELNALKGFFTTPWTETVPSLTGTDQGLIFGIVGFSLRALGNLNESVPILQRSQKTFVAAGDLPHAAQVAGYVSETYWVLGRLNEALVCAEESVRLADQSAVPFFQVYNRTTLGDVLFRLGKFCEAQKVFEEAQRRNGQDQLMSMPSARYCEFLLNRGRYEEVIRHARAALIWEEKNDRHLLSIARHRMCLGRALLLHTGDSEEVRDLLKRAVKDLDDARLREDVPWGLAVRAAFYREIGRLDEAKDDLTKALNIANECGCKILQADCHLEFCRLHLAFSLVGSAPEHRTEACKHLEETMKLIESTGYRMRQREMERLEQELKTPRC